MMLSDCGFHLERGLRGSLGTNDCNAAWSIMISTSRGFFEALVGDGRPLIVFTALCLALAGVFALFQSATGHFLPQDVSFLGMSAPDLCGFNECRIVHFMIHDRVSFGGGLIAIAVLYLWLAEFPLRGGESWAWWTLAGQRSRRLRQFPLLFGLRLSRHVARGRDDAAVALFHRAGCGCRIGR